MVNVRAIANGITRAINPNIVATARISQGYSRDRAYKRDSSYRDVPGVTIQVQSISKRELEHLAQMNISNATRAAYANIQLTGVDRNDQSGGDLLIYPDPETGRVEEWLVIAVLEGWTTAGWCKVALGKQLS